MLDLVGNDVVLPAAGDVLLVHSALGGKRVEGLAFACSEVLMDSAGSATSFWVSGYRCQEPDLRKKPAAAMRAAEEIHNLAQTWMLDYRTRVGATAAIEAIAAIIVKEGGIK